MKERHIEKTFLLNMFWNGAGQETAEVIFYFSQIECLEIQSVSQREGQVQIYGFVNKMYVYI